MKQFFYKGVPLKAITLRILDVNEDENQNVITVPCEDGVGLTYYFPSKSDLKIKPQIGDALTIYALDCRYYGMDINGKPQFRRNGFEEKEVKDSPIKEKTYSFKGIPVMVVHQEIVKVQKINTGYSLTFDTGYGFRLAFEHAKTVPTAGDLFTTYLLCNNRVVRGDLNGVQQFRDDGFEEK